jgi:hypothetical protein
VTPALEFERFIETMFALAADGKLSKRGMPSPLRLAVTRTLTSPTRVHRTCPPGCRRPASRRERALGGLLGYEATYERHAPEAPAPTYEPATA